MVQKKVTWQSPSNIALIKYWGKHDVQIPANPSLSFTLSKSFTETSLTILDEPGNKDFDFELYLDQDLRPDFKPKITTFLKRIEADLDFLKGQKFRIETHNSFPHSSGIASSASGMSALALCLLSLKQELESKKEESFFKKASTWSRLGSGSASRSVYPKLSLWGKHKAITESSDDYAIAFPERVDPIFEDFCDYILLVDKGEKKVSSTVGHQLMNNHPYAQRRFLQAHENLDALLKYLKLGDVESFGEIVESEALTLHAMMMTSMPYFILMKPNTLKILEMIWAFRKETSIPAYFTLDAGANVHLLFPKVYEQQLGDWVNTEVKALLKNGDYICDAVGNGPLKL